MFNRVARHVAAAHAEAGTTAHDELAKAYVDLMSSLKFLPNTPTFTGAGTPLGQLAACFVLPIDDDIGKDSKAGIFETLSKAARIQQSGGGVGFSFSRLRPRGDRVQKSAGVASGPVSFIKVYNAALGAIRGPPSSDAYTVSDTFIGAEPVDFECASGPIAFMKAYNSAFEAIAQGMRLLLPFSSLLTT
jgi:ribonucleotide reductase alpha subunit